MVNRRLHACVVFLLVGFPVFAETLIVLAASSTTDAMKAVGERYSQQSGHQVKFSFGSAGALARQIQNGAPADIFVSANDSWMDVLVDERKVDPATRIALLKNQLVLVAPKGKEVVLNDQFSGRLAVGHMQSVPSGMYARQMMLSNGWFEALQPRLVECDSVRNVLFFVERGEVDAGIVYATDALMSDRVAVMTVFPEGTHDPIRYPVAVCTSSARRQVSVDFIAYLQSDEARVLFEKFGFKRVDPVL